MAVLINGIEMPKGADEHRLIIRANGQVIIDKKTYWEEAKAVPVPPHGRLIDADKLRAAFPAPEDWRNVNEALYHVTGIWAAIDAAETALPAEEGET